LKFLENYDIPIKDCRGQSYDNASNMARQYSSLQVRIKEKYKFAIFIPCVAYSFSGHHATGCVLEVTSFFQLVQRLYNFCSFLFEFYPSVEYTECLGLNKVIKCLSERWSARADVVGTLHQGLQANFESLDIVC